MHIGKSAMSLRYEGYASAKPASYCISFKGMFSGISYVLETIPEMKSDGRRFGRFQDEDKVLLYL